MNTLSTLDDLRRLLLARGGERYDGEDVSHLDHALQCAALARRSGAADALLVAALLHDVGHLAHDTPATPSAAGIDDAHETLGAALLARWFGAAVCEPVRLHVAAKRRLAAEPRYQRALSADSLRSLALQGGPMTEAEQSEFERTPHANEAVRLRRWDDSAKSPDRVVPTLDDWWPLVQRLSR